MTITTGFRPGRLPEGRTMAADVHRPIPYECQCIGGKAKATYPTLSVARRVIRRRRLTAVLGAYVCAAGQVHVGHRR